MRTFNKTPLALGVAAGMAMLVASTGAQADSTGTDLNLSAHTIAGGMAGAAYTRPQEASAAVFGNPATLTQFPGVNFNFGAAHIFLQQIEVETTTVTGAANGANALGLPTYAATNTHTSSATSDADNYIIPTLGISLQVSPKLFLGLGLEADAGLGADYRNDPISLTGMDAAGLASVGYGEDLTIPLLVEVISFNANVAAAYQATEKLSLGASVTIGFGLAQLGTAGETTGLSAALTDVGGNTPTFDGLAPAVGAPGLVGNDAGFNIFSDFGGTTSSVHDIGLGWSLGATYEVNDNITTSLAVKSAVEYQFDDIISFESSYAQVLGAATLGAPASGIGAGLQHLDIEQPLEVIAGIAYEKGGLLVEADVIWKNWSDASAYEDVYEDQFKIALGAQYKVDKWSFRAGYSWSEEILKDTPNNTLGTLNGVGSIPLGDTALATDAALEALGLPAGLGFVDGAAVDVVELVQMSLVPVIYQHNVTAGVGYNFTDAVSVNAFASYAFAEEDSRSLETLIEVVNLAGPAGVADGANLLPVVGLPTIDTVTNDGFNSLSVKQDLGGEIFVGVGINVALP
ncbi:MAG TPA: long-chain fatty acid transport protein [Cycloclasticus sp.]|jgi:long-chain fatty acid transport protein|nr:long-chain fatty acid transport protein [Cycloclasticus sp.]HIL92445.1 long-chain fatty acid transport protein [Cycloclasticus sp.]